mmetsp:Transcript_88909/g.226248  ORF Transcript_88909/g.226248 Transcript_88909/m.226248 type:complete len:221 (+) Transcript_88909:788-1450(+)
MRETNIDELLRVQRAVVVAALRNGPWEHDAGSVDRLPNVLLVHAPCDLLDQDGSQALAPQLFVDTQEVDLDHGDQVFIHLDARGDAGDESDQLTARLHAHAQVPMPQELGRLEGPPQEAHRIIKTEHAVVVLDIVLAQKHVDLLSLGFVVDVARAPLEGVGQSVRLVTDLSRGLDLVNGTCVLSILGAYGRHRLSVPERVRPLVLPTRLFTDAGLPEDLE